jgi:hypothetical protein
MNFQSPPIMATFANPAPTANHMKTKQKQTLTLDQWFQQVRQWSYVLEPHKPTPSESRGWEGQYNNGLTPEQAVRQNIDSGA